MLKKKYRKVQNLAMHLTYRVKKDEEIVSKPNFINSLKKLQNKINEEGILINKYSNENICIGLRQIDISESEEYAVLLFAAGDKDIVDPSFWEASGDIIRNETTQGDERISYSCHVVIYLNKIVEDGSIFILAKENIPIVSVGLLSKFFNYMLSNYAKDTLVGEDDCESICTPCVTFEKLASKTMKDALMAKKPIGIEAVYAEKINSAHDENFETKKKTRRLSLVPQREWGIDGFIEKMNALIPTLSEYNEIYVRYKDDAKKEGSIKFEIDELEEQDLNTYLFSQIQHVYLDNEIGQFSDTPHDELVRRMYILIKDEYRLVTTR